MIFSTLLYSLLLIDVLNVNSPFLTQSITCNGLTSYMATALSPSLNLTTHGSTSAWIKTTSTNASFPGLFGRWDSGQSDRQYFMYYNTSFQPEFFVSGDGVSFVGVSAAAAINDGNWHFVVGTFDGSTGTLKVYIDGSVSNTATGGPASLHTGPAPFSICNDFNNNSPGGEYIAAQVAAPWVYSSTLTGPQVTSLYNAGTPKDNTTVVGSSVSGWKLSGNGNDFVDGNPLSTAVDITYTGDVP